MNLLHYIHAFLRHHKFPDMWHTFLQDRDVRIVVNKGYASWTFLYKNAERLAEINQEYLDKDIHVYILAILTQAAKIWTGI
jgi:hypothetical protein